MPQVLHPYVAVRGPQTSRQSPSLAYLAIPCLVLVTWIVLFPPQSVTDYAPPVRTSVAATPPSTRSSLVSSLPVSSTPSTTTTTTLSTTFKATTKQYLTLSNASVFVHKIYFDDRFKDGLRVLFLANCEVAKKVEIFVNGKRHAGTLVPIEGECPWHWAPSCAISSHVLTIPSVRVKPVGPVEVRHGARSVPVPVTAVATLRPDSLEVCVPPLYWYGNWPQLIAFIELWRQQKVSHFYFYHYSVSRTVLRILEYYQNKGLVTLIPWPALPSSPQYDPNSDVYRIAHSIAHNDCLRRTRGAFTALVDVDEFILARSDGGEDTEDSRTPPPNLLELLHDLVELKPRAGSFRFVHRQLSIVPLDVKNTTSSPLLDFTGIHRSFVVDHDGPKKVVFRPERALVLNTHSVREYRSPKWHTWKVSTDDGLLYHVRDNWARDEPAGVTPLAHLFPRSHTKAFEVNTRRVLANVFGTTPTYNESLSKEVGVCLKRSKEAGCKTLISTCFQDLDEFEDWVIAEAAMSPFTVL